MPAPERLRPLVAADVALRLGLAKPWDVMAALQARGAGGHASLDEFLADLSRIARLGPDELAQLQAETEQRLALGASDAAQALSRMGGPVASMVPHPRVAGTGVAGDDAVVGASAPLRRIADGRYRDFAPVGEGGMGIVYWALDTELNRQVAFKIVRPDIAVTGGDHTPTTPLHATPPRPDSPASRAFHELRARFLQEAWVTGGLEHPGVVPVYEMGQTAHGIPYYTMRFVRGNRTLSTALEEVSAFGPQGRLQLLEPFLKVCDTIGYAHSRGVIHRDLKPQNIALGEFGEVVVLDWGLAKMKGGADPAASRWQERIADYRASASLQTALGPLGTPGYMSPEAALGQLEEVAESSDIYSLGTILFEILTGRLPFTFTTYGEYVAQVSSQPAPAAIDVDPAVPQVLSDLCERALSQSPSRRPAQPAEVAAVIRQWQADTALASEIDQALQEARATLRAAGYVTGDERIQALDRVAGVCEQVLRRQADQAEARAMLGQAGSQRAEALAERDRAARRRLVRLAGVAALAAATLVAVGTAFAINAEKRQAERATHAAETASAEREEQRLRANREAGEARAARAQAESSARVAEAAESRAQAQAREASEARALAERKAQEAVAEAKRATEAGQALERSYQRARALALAAAAQREVQHNPTLALHLAVTALEADPVGEAMTAGLAVLQSPIEQAPIHVSGGAVADVEFMADAQQLLTLSKTGVIELWGAHGTRLRAFPGLTPAPYDQPALVAAEHRDAKGNLIPAVYESREVTPVLALRYLVGSTSIVTLGPTLKTARIWALDASARVLEGHNSRLTAVAMDAASGFAATGDESGEVRLWSPEGKEVRRFEGEGHRVIALAVANAGHWTAMASLDGSVRILPRSGPAITLRYPIRTFVPHPVSQVRQAPTLNVLGANHLLVPVDLGYVVVRSDGSEAWRVPPAPWTSLSSDYGLTTDLVGVSREGKTTFFSGEYITYEPDGKEIGRFRFIERGEHAHNCLLAPSGTHVTASMCGETDFRAYDVVTGRSHLLIPTQRSMDMHYARPSANLTRVAVWSPGGSVVRVYERKVPDEAGVESMRGAYLAFDASDRVLEYEPGSGRVRRWDAGSGRVEAELAIVTPVPTVAVEGDEGAPEPSVPVNPSWAQAPHVEARDDRVLFAARTKPDRWEVLCLVGSTVVSQMEAGQVWMSPTADRLLIEEPLAADSGSAPSEASRPAREQPSAAQPLRLLDTQGRLLARLPPAGMVQFDRTGSRFLCTHGRDTVTVYDRDGRAVASMAGSLHASLSPTGTHVLRVLPDGQILLRTLADGGERPLPKAGRRVTEASAAPPDADTAQLAGPRPQFIFFGRGVVYRDAGGAVVVHDLLGRAVQTLCQPGEQLSWVLPPNGECLLGVVAPLEETSAERRPEQWLWRLDHGPLRLTQYEAGDPTVGDLSADGSTIALRGAQNAIQILDTEGRERCSVLGRQPHFNWRLSPTGNALLAGSTTWPRGVAPSGRMARNDSDAQLWWMDWEIIPLEPRSLLVRLRGRSARPLQAEERSRYADLLDAPR